MKSTTEKGNSLRKKWLGRDITEVKYNADPSHLEIEFVDGDDLVTLQSKNVMLFSICMSPGDHEPPWFGDINTEVHQHPSKEKLYQFGYRWTNSEPIEAATSIHIEGAVIIDIIIYGELQISRCKIDD